MSLLLLRLFVNTTLHNLLRSSHPRSVLQVRGVTAMELAPIVDTKEAVDKAHQIIVNKNLTRFKKRLMKRQWEEISPRKKENGESDEKKVCDKLVERIKRKKMALLLGYCGVDYYGMQRNPGVRTIEEDLLKALWEAKYITEEDFNNQQNMQFQRSSRTDKGVSAARQVVSLKLPLHANTEEINKRLPDCIKVFGIKRATNKFNSKSKCNARTYSYTLPTYVFEPSSVTEEERTQYRITEEKLEKVKSVLAVYKGTKSYHNFTEKKHYQDPSASRYMIGFTVEKIFVESDMEFAVLLVKGQSFMLHQIRKMVGLAIAVVRSHTDMSTLEKAFGKEKVMIPTAPGLGLVLDMVHYDRYDAKFKQSHESLTWDKEEEAVQQFKHKHIYPVIVKGELEHNSMITWLEKLSLHSYEPNEENQKIDDKELGGDDDDNDEDDDDNDDSETKNSENKKINCVTEMKNDDSNKKDDDDSEMKNNENEKTNCVTKTKNDDSDKKDDDDSEMKNSENEKINCVIETKNDDHLKISDGSEKKNDDS